MLSNSHQRYKELLSGNQTKEKTIVIFSSQSQKDIKSSKNAKTIYLKSIPNTGRCKNPLKPTNRILDLKDKLSLSSKYQIFNIIVKQKPLLIINKMIQIYLLTSPQSKVKLMISNHFLQID